MDTQTEKMLDGWAGSYDWRDALQDGEITEAELLQQLIALEEMEPTEEEESEGAE